MNLTDPIAVGVLTPHAAAGPEAELPLLAPGRVRATVSRIGSGEPPTSPPGLRALATPAALDRAASAFPAGSVDVLAYASTSTGYALGPDAEAALVRRLRDRWGVPVCASSRSAVAALRFLRVTRVSLVHPPWFGSTLHRLGAAYFAGQGFEVVDAVLADLPADPDRIEPAMIVDRVARHLSPRAGAVVIGGNGFRAAQAVQPLEDRVGRPVIESNQVLLWSALAGAGVSTDIRGFGTLLTKPEGATCRS